MYRTLLILVFVLPPAYLLYLIFIYLHTKVPYVVTPKKRLPLIIENMHITSDSVIYDLGCGKGDVLFAAEKLHAKKLIGFELSPIHAWYANIKSFFLRSKVQVYRRDFFTADITEANIIYIFLVQTVVEKLWAKIQKEAKPGTKVFILSNKIPNFEGQFVTAVENGTTTPGGIYVYTVGERVKNS
jgi:ribosomal protein L11 methylase PrmA